MDKKIHVTAKVTHTMGNIQIEQSSTDFVYLYVITHTDDNGTVTRLYLNEEEYSALEELIREF